MADNVQQSLRMQRRKANKIAQERQAGLELKASNAEAAQGHVYEASLYKSQSQATIKKAHPLKGDRKSS